MDDTYHIPSTLENVEEFNENTAPLQNEADFSVQPEVPRSMKPENTLYHDPALTRRFLEVISPLESTPDSRIADLQQMGKEVEAFRATATEASLNRTLAQKMKERITMPTRPLIERLIDEESHYGGKVFYRPPFVKEPLFDEDEQEIPTRFWYLDGYYYYEPNQNQNLVISYHIAEEGIYKAVNGRPTPMLPTEMDSLVAAATLSHDEVLRKMYPVDPVVQAVNDAINDLLTDDGESLDHLDYLDRLKH